MAGSTPLSIGALDAAAADAFVAALGDLFEHSPWVASGVAGSRPFRTARALHDAMMRVVRDASPDAQLALIAAHPELAGAEMVMGVPTSDSTGEQATLGFTRLTKDEHTTLAAMNASYRARFGFRFIVALCRHATRESVFAAMQTRLTSDLDTERHAAIDEIGHITRARLAARLGRAGGALTIHALDTVRGGGAPDLRLTLQGLRDGAWQVLATRRTDDHGCVAEPLLTDIDMEPGAYRVDYQVGAYHRSHGIALPDPAFLEIVSIGFGIADAGAHYHIPVQFTPWSYATCRGG